MRGDRDILWKWVIIGDSGVGKTSILSRLCNDEFNNTFISTIGIDFKIKKMEVGGKNVTVQIWDTAGQERFGTITRSCYRGSVGVILVYDTNSRTSFEDVNKWLNDIKLHTGEDVAKILLGNKCDMQSSRAVSLEEGQEAANRSGIPFLETSAKTGKNIEKAFFTLAEQILGESVSVGLGTNTNNNNNHGENNTKEKDKDKNKIKNGPTSVNNDSYRSGGSSAQSKLTSSSATSNSTEAIHRESSGFKNHRNSLTGIIKLTGIRSSSNVNGTGPDPTTTTQQSDQSFQLTEQDISTSNLNAKKSRCC